MSAPDVRDSIEQRYHEVNVDGKPATILTRDADYTARIWLCRICGALTLDRIVHDSWHGGQR